MAEIIDSVMKFVEDELTKNPDARSKDLFEAAKKVDPAIKKLNQRQFHARYPLQVHRMRAPKKPRVRRARKAAVAASAAKVTAPRGRRAASKAGSSREAARAVLFRFARDLTASSEPQNLVKVMSNIDQYVDDIVTS